MTQIWCLWVPSLLLLSQRSVAAPRTPQPDTPMPRTFAGAYAKVGPQCSAYQGTGESYSATTLRQHGPTSVACTASKHSNRSLGFRSPVVAPAFCSQPYEKHGAVADACYQWDKDDYYPLTQASVLGISGPRERWHGDRARLRKAVSAAMEGKPLRVMVLGTSFTAGHGCPVRYFNGTAADRVVWPTRLDSMLKWMFPENSAVEVDMMTYPGADSFSLLRQLYKFEAKPADVYIIDFSLNDMRSDSKRPSQARGTAATTAAVVKGILEFANQPALLYVELFGHKAAPFCDVSNMDNCEADPEHGFQKVKECFGHDGCDFGNFTVAGCKVDERTHKCPGKLNWAPPKGVMDRCSDLVKCGTPPYPVPAHLGDLRASVREQYAEWWYLQMTRGRAAPEHRVNELSWGCDPGGAAGNFHMAALEHFHVPVVSFQDATCDFEQCGPLSPQRYPLWPKGDPHPDCLPAHQIVADLVAGIFALETLRECGIVGPAASESMAAVGSGGLQVGSTAAALDRDDLRQEDMSGLEMCDKPLVDLDAFEEWNSDGPSKAVQLGDFWRLEEDRRSKYGWVFMRDRAIDSRNDTKPAHGWSALRKLAFQLAIRRGTVVVEFMRSYQSFGDAKCWFELIKPAPGYETDARNATKHRRPEPRLLSGHWDAKVSMIDHESFTGFWPPGEWALIVEPAMSCEKFKVVTVLSC